MKVEARLDSAVFQLTPTRTRCELVIIANGKKEKLASGLLNPFLAHLKSAQDQISKGGYSITLEPNSQNGVAWFTKGTLERFVRFVSNPEVLERVDTIESEMQQIDEAIAVQSIENLKVEDLQSKPARSTEVLRPGTDYGAEKAIVLFQPGAHPSEANGSAVQEENSKVQLLRVLDTRKAVLRKEQGMAFARAVAAGFDVDQMSDLVEFSECFGASRLMKACLKYMELWKQKHETGQWVEVEVAEIMSAQSEFISHNASGIMLSADSRMQSSNFGVELESNGKASPDTGDVNLHIGMNGDKKPTDSQLPGSLPEQFHGQFHHPMYGQWPIQPPPGVPMFPSYPMHSMPFYQNYPGGQLYPPYASSEDFNKGHRRRRNKSHSTDDKDSFTGSEDTEDEIFVEKKSTKARRSHRKGRHPGRKKSSSSVRTSGSDSEIGSEHESTQPSSHEKKNKNSALSAKVDKLDSRSLKEQDDDMYRHSEVNGNWDAFQNFLLQEKEETENGRSGFVGEREISFKKRNNTGEPDPLNRGRYTDDGYNNRTTEFDAAGNPQHPIYRSKASNGEMGLFQKGQNVADMHLEIQRSEMESGRGGYRRMSSDDFIVNGQYNPMGNGGSFSDPLAEGKYAHTDNKKGLTNGLKDESFIVPHRSSFSEQMEAASGNPIDMVAEFPSAFRTGDDKSLIGYEPDGLSLMPERTTERESIGYDPAMDYEMEARPKVVQENGKDVDAKNVKEILAQSNKEKKATVVKKKIEPTTRRNQPSRLPTTDSRQRAERLQSFKSEIQKVKKEKEEEQLKRLEELKLERQKRIAARSGQNGSQSSPTLQQRGSKFSDSPLRKSVGASPQTNGLNRAANYRLSR